METLAQPSLPLEVVELDLSQDQFPDEQFLAEFLHEARNFPSIIIGDPIDAVASLQACMSLYYQVSGEYMQELAQAMTEKLARKQVEPITEESDESYQNRTEEFERTLYQQLWLTEPALEQAHRILQEAGQPALVPPHHNPPRLQRNREAVVPPQLVLPRLHTARQLLGSFHGSIRLEYSSIALTTLHLQDLLQRVKELGENLRVLRSVIAYQLGGHNPQGFAPLKYPTVTALPKSTVRQELREGDGEELLECAICKIDLNSDDEVIKLPRCNHWIWHLACIKAWLEGYSASNGSRPSCSLCRQAI